MLRRKAVVRQQFPLKASSVKTIRKAQVQTKNQITVDMTSGSRPRQHYVAFSRVTSLQWLFLLNGLSGRIKADKSIIQEMNRLRKDAYIKLSLNPVSSHNCYLITVFQNCVKKLASTFSTYTEWCYIHLCRYHLFSRDLFTSKWLGRQDFIRWFKTISRHELLTSDLHMA